MNFQEVFKMSEQEIIQLFNDRYLNSKTNNFIFAGIDDFSILDHIPDKCCISPPENHHQKMNLQNY